MKTIERFYWAVRRGWQCDWGPSALRRAVVKAWQRVTVGIADEDTWALDDFLTHVIVIGVDRLRRSKRGFPASLLDECLTDDLCMERWHSILDQIVRGFCARSMLAQGMDWQINALTGRYEQNEALALRLKEEQDKGMALFVEYFDALWN